jgi:hypothetical protein
MIERANLNISEFKFPKIFNLSIRYETTRITQKQIHITLKVQNGFSALALRIDNNTGIFC